MDTAANRMDSTAMNAISDANVPNFGTNFSIAMILRSDTTSATPSIDGVSFNYDGNVINRDETDQYTIEMPDVDTIKITAPSSGTSRNARVYVTK